MAQRLLTTKEYCAITNENQRTAEYKRLHGSGCPFIKLGRLVRYRPEDVEAYIERHAATSTRPLAPSNAEATGR